MKFATFLAIAIVVIAAGAIMFNRNAKPHASNSENSIAQTTNSATNSSPGTNAFSEPGTFKSGTQNTASSGIILRQINMPKSGFVVIQDDNNGTPGSVLGTSNLLQAGMNQLVPVNTSVAIVPLNTYFVSLYADTNGNGMFDSNTDILLTNDSGQALQQPFTAPAASSTPQQ